MGGLGKYSTCAHNGWCCSCSTRFGQIWISNILCATFYVSFCIACSRARSSSALSLSSLRRKTWQNAVKKCKLRLYPDSYAMSLSVAHCKYLFRVQFTRNKKRNNGDNSEFFQCQAYERRYNIPCYLRLDASRDTLLTRRAARLSSGK